MGFDLEAIRQSAPVRGSGGGEEDVMERATVKTYIDQCNALDLSGAADCIEGLAAEVDRLRPLADEVHAARHVMREHNRLLVELAASQEELRATKEVEFPRKVEAVVRKVETKWQAELAASQAREVQLREAVRQNHEWHNNYDEYGGYPESELCEVNTEALSAPQDTSALEALIARAGEVMRERCAEKIESQHTWVTSAAASALIRALPGVTLEDLKWAAH